MNLNMCIPCTLWVARGQPGYTYPNMPRRAACVGVLEYGVAMAEVDTVARRTAVGIETLQRRGAVFAYLHGSRAAGTAAPGSDVDIAAYFDDPAPQAFEVALPAGVDLLVLNGAPLELAGRIALHGQLLFERDSAARVVWEATTRKIYLDELPRMTRAHQEFAEAVLHRGG
jgi:predicted nucleotidyltransferase